MDMKIREIIRWDCVKLDKDLEIQDFNWHITSSLDGDYLNQSPTGYDPVNIFALQKGFLFFRYSSASNPDDINTYEEWDNRKWRLTLNSEKGFIRGMLMLLYDENLYAHQDGSSTFKWSYSIYGKFHQLISVTTRQSQKIYDHFRITNPEEIHIEGIRR
ncbi:hypothetical protein Glove_109g167 [Diversispora epigaea]|uniref:Uncharacterized protein n=1 Tax=Diversispora epigaea TaxID=1348612 RepID=A0A397J2T8_9GLOM|nr:hypothetical protein Glove_109g167 [Diversispora epigaea]